jgi:hypothetical protein
MPGYPNPRVALFAGISMVPNTMYSLLPIALYSDTGRQVWNGSHHRNSTTTDIKLVRLPKRTHNSRCNM